MQNSHYVRLMQSKFFVTQFIAGIFIMTISQTSFAVNFKSEHACNKPIKPSQFKSLQQLSDFNQQYDYYKTCLFTFIEQHKHQAVRHQQTANTAIDEWNKFVDEMSSNQKLD